MVTQKYKQGDNDIKIESAESLADAKENGFEEGEYHKYYVNGKITKNYMAMIRFIVDESKKNMNRMVPTGPKLSELREEMIDRQNKSISEQLNKIKHQYSVMNISEDFLNKSNNFIKKIDPIGMRIKE